MQHGEKQYKFKRGIFKTWIYDEEKRIGYIKSSFSGFWIQVLIEYSSETDRIYEQFLTIKSGD